MNMWPHLRLFYSTELPASEHGTSEQIRKLSTSKNVRGQKRVNLILVADHSRSDKQGFVAGKRADGD